MKLKKNYIIDVYRSKLTVVITDDMVAAAGDFPLQMDKDKLEHSMGVFNYYRDVPLHCFMILREDITPGEIAHEAFHMVAYLMDYIGSNLDGESEEPYAYLLTCIVDKIHNALDLYNKKLES